MTQRFVLGFFGKLRLCVTVAAVLFGALPAGAQQGAVKGKFGDWQMRCETPAGASAEQCALVQSLVAEDKPNVNMVVVFLKTADGKSRLLRVITELGVLLPNGLGLDIDGKEIGHAGFSRCIPTGCYAEVIMDEKLIDLFRTGKTATFIIYETPDKGIGLPLTLTGFKDGFAKLP